MSSPTPGAHCTARVLANGPLELRGSAILLNGEPVGAEAWLCRCGASASKPWCDGSHKTAACVLTGEPPLREGRDLPESGAPLNLEPQPNGAVKATGPLVILNDAGAVTDRVTQAFLCRCGQSARQPYCDGSHKRAGFVAP
ncbi:CDGSH iron-sulfur domain-containing protein [Roseomonas rosulenta]|uniref:CDGSH iron-sulfur domain-containing protein n=1 Tax=Roseomonas rosulenta TaxID=2748667 RepID=UPI0018DF08D0|nr:CDGSH iron-sulfur domain-containing protein [Roseomonas rosulenta]